MQMSPAGLYAPRYLIFLDQSRTSDVVELFPHQAKLHSEKYYNFTAVKILLTYQINKYILLQVTRRFVLIYHLLGFWVILKATLKQVEWRIVSIE